LLNASGGGSYAIGAVAGAMLGFSLSLWLTLSGIGIIRKQSSAVDSIRRWAMVKIGFYTLCLGSMMILMPIAASGARRQSATPFDGMEVPMLVGILAGVLAWFVAWPIFVLFWFSRAKVQADINRWRD
jgi:hypothetical protein